jgi:signal transduction histidine kinase
MVDTVSLTRLVRQKIGFHHIVAIIAFVTIFIFIIDLITPVGILIWILYLIPLFLTTYLNLKYAPVVMAGVIIFLMAVNFFQSPQDISAEYALLNLTFFVVFLGIVTVFIERYISNVENLTKSKGLDEEHSRINDYLRLLIAITDHEVRRRLAVIYCYIELAKGNTDDPKLGMFLEKVESPSREIQKQLEFTRSNLDLIYLKPQWIDLDTVIPRSQVPSTITLESSVQGISVFAIPMLDKIFFDLLDNSIQHGERVTKIRISFYKEGRNLVVAWDDDGVGIAAANKKSIFGIGWRPKGLGMFLVREYLSLADMTIIETGEQGKGVRFEIFVPEGKWRMTGKVA